MVRVWWISWPLPLIFWLRRLHLGRACGYHQDMWPWFFSADGGLWAVRVSWGVLLWLPTLIIKYVS